MARSSVIQELSGGTQRTMRLHKNEDSIEWLCDTEMQHIQGTGRLSEVSCQLAFAM